MKHLFDRKDEELTEVRQSTYLSYLLSLVCSMVLVAHLPL